MTNSNYQSIIYKEYLSIKSKLTSYVKLMSFYWLLTTFGLFPLWLAVAMGQVLWILSPLALLSSTEEENSVRERFFVKARYDLALAFGTISTFLHLLLLIFWQIFSSGNFAFYVLVTSTVFAYWILFITFPIFYLVKNEKGKSWFFLILLTALCIFVMNYKYITNSIVEFWTVKALSAALLSLIAGYWISLSLCKKIMQRNNFSNDLFYS